MKKLNGMKKFSSLENKKLEELKFIKGGMNLGTSDWWTDDTCSNNRPDRATYRDGNHVQTVYS